MTQTIHNFYPKARENLLQAVAGFSAKGLKRTAKHTAAFIEEADKAVKFALPLDGRLLDDQLRGLPDGWRLPYPSILVEYQVDSDPETLAKDNPEWARNPSPGRVVLAIEMPREQALEVMRDSLSDEVLTGLFAKAEVSHCTLISAAILTEIEGTGRWIWVVNWSSMIVANACGGAMQDKSLPGIVLIPENELATALAERYKGQGVDHHEAAYHDIWHETRSVLELIEALSCANVEATKVPAPPKLNAKRIKRGKLPLPDYHVLTVKTPVSKAQGAAGGSGLHHASPRQHLRRGHIRIYQSGLRIWVQACVVGDPARGRLDKAYRVTA
jgi:hypothetical protein